MQYPVQYGDSPLKIAQKFGVSIAALLSANPQKPTKVVAGKRTWDQIRPGEKVHIPVKGMVGAVPAVDAINALITYGGPCLEKNVGIVCDVQRALGVTVDGKYGSGTAAAARAVYPSAPAGCSPRPTWWAPVGKSNCPAGTVAPTPSAPSPSLPTVPPTLLALVGINPCDKSNVLLICSAQRILGLTVDGKYGSGTAAAARRLVPNAPPACSPRPAWWAPVGQSNCTPAAMTSLPPPVPSAAPAPAPSMAAAPAAVQALIGINPCLQSNVAIICAAQKALNVTVDGKYGSGTATAARAKLGSAAPPACSPRPAWWKPAGQSNCPTGAAPAPTPPPLPPPPTPGGVTQPKWTTMPDVVALLKVNPCDQANVALVCAVQRALGVTVDGKYGSGTATALRKLNSSAPAACSPRPSWWKPPGQSNCPGAVGPAPTPGPIPSPVPGPVPTPVPSPVPSPVPTPTPVPGPLPVPAPIPTPPEPGGACPPGSTPDPNNPGMCLPTGAPSDIIIQPEEKKGLSTGALVAGGLGVAALVGLIAVAATSGKKKRGGKSRPSTRKSKPSRRKAPKKRRK